MSASSSSKDSPGGGLAENFLNLAIPIVLLEFDPGLTLAVGVVQYETSDQLLPLFCQLHDVFPWTARYYPEDTPK